MAITTRLDLFIRPTSTATLQQAIDHSFNWANNRTNHNENIDENGDEIKAYYIDVTDGRNGQKFMVFGTLAQEVLQLPKVLHILNKEEFAKAEIEDTVATHSQEIEDLKNADYDSNTTAVII